MIRLAFAFLASIAAASPVFAADRPCPVEAPCSIGEGEYAMSFPADWDGETPLRTLVFYHGHNSSMEKMIRSIGLRDGFVARGWLVVAPQGKRLSEDGPRGWPGRPNAEWRDDVAFSLAVLDDAAARAPIAGRPVVSGFSAGGSMAWMMGCYEGSRFEALVSVAGALRRPNPDTCPDPAERALHIHGFMDAQVPYEGRAIRDWHQGNVSDTLSLFRRSRGCRSNPDEIAVGEVWRTRVWKSCETGDLAYVEYDGGHRMPPGWPEVAQTWLETGSPVREE
ncbi:MAG: hypothetical protein AAF322_15550 [Pseudomonadota bacterium]